MKKTILSIVLGATILFGAQNVQAQEKAIDAAASNIHWKGEKFTGKYHEGNISLKSGSFTLDNGTVTGGNFIVDMASMTCTDLEGGSAERLIGHLSSDDFFGVATHPEAKLVFTKVTAKGNGVYAVSGDFTIKGITNEASFDLTVIGNEAKAKVNIDRSKHNVRYGSNSFFDNLGDKAIDNNFELDVTLKI